MMTTSEKVTQKSMTCPRLSVHHTSFLWALCQELVLSTTQRFVAPSGEGLPFWEISAGQVVGETRVGATFVGRANGQLPGLLYASVNYTPPRPGPNVVNTITGGQWSLVGSWGVLYGSFTGGEVLWNSAGTQASVNAEMVIVGGRVNGKVVSGGSGSFAGTLSHLTFPPTISGTLMLTPSFRTTSAFAR
jgi:hypothetical protein